MKVQIIVDSKFGNTAQIADAIARGATAAGAVVAPTLRAIDADPASAGADADLLLVGGPTQNHGMSKSLAAFVERLPRRAGALAGAFDTRMPGSELFMGSAAKRAAQKLRRSGYDLVGPKESFLIVRPAPTKGEEASPEGDHLADGELERAEAWGSTVVAAAAARGRG